MRVKLSYSVDIEEVLDEVSELFGYAVDKSSTVQNQVETTRDLIWEESPEAATDLINKTRKSLAELDARLADLSLILEGYVQYQKQKSGDNNETSSGRPAVDTTGNNAVQGSEQPDGGQV